jgi:hypothetical protein
MIPVHEQLDEHEHDYNNGHTHRNIHHNCKYHNHGQTQSKRIDHQDIHVITNMNNRNNNIHTNINGNK